MWRQISVVGLDSLFGLSSSLLVPSLAALWLSGQWSGSGKRQWWPREEGGISLRALPWLLWYTTQGLQSVNGIDLVQLCEMCKYCNCHSGSFFASLQISIPSNLWHNLQIVYLSPHILQNVFSEFRSLFCCSWSLFCKICKCCSWSIFFAIYFCSILFSLQHFQNEEGVRCWMANVIKYNHFFGTLP